MSTSANLNELLGSAGLGNEAMSSMQLTADDMGPAIMAGLGTVGLDDVHTSEVLLVTQLLDDSGSIRFASNAQAVRDGHNLIIDALRGAKQAAAVLASCRYLNDNSRGTDQGVLYPYRPLDGADTLNASNYDPVGGTPLYDQTAVVLTTVTAKMAEFENEGVAARAVTAIVTDGADEHSYRHNANTVRAMVQDMLATEQHIIIGVGIDDGRTDFKRVFGDMGILPEWILTPGNTESEIRAAFRTVSQSAVQASQATGAHFSQVALGGFGGNP